MIYRCKKIISLKQRGKSLFAFIFLILLISSSNVYCLVDVLECKMQCRPLNLAGITGCIIVDENYHLYPIFFDSELDVTQKMDGIINAKKQEIQRSINDNSQRNTNNQREIPKLNFKVEGNKKEETDFCNQVHVLKSILFDFFEQNKDDASKQQIYYMASCTIPDFLTKCTVPYGIHPELFFTECLAQLFCYDYFVTFLRFGEQWIRMLAKDKAFLTECVSAIGRSPIPLKSHQKEQAGKNKEPAQDVIGENNAKFDRQLLTISNCYSYVNIRYTNKTEKEVPGEAVLSTVPNETDTGMSSVFLGINTMGTDVGACTLAILIYDVLKNYDKPNTVENLDKLISSLIQLFYKQSVLTESVKGLMKYGYDINQRELVPNDESWLFSQRKPGCECGVCLCGKDFNYMSRYKDPYNPSHTENVYFACCIMFVKSLQCALMTLNKSNDPKESLDKVLYDYYMGAYKYFPQDLNSISFIERLKLKNRLLNDPDLLWHYAVDYAKRYDSSCDWKNYPANRKSVAQYVKNKMELVYVDFYGYEAEIMFDLLFTRKLLPEKVFYKPYYTAIQAQHQLTQKKTINKFQEKVLVSENESLRESMGRKKNLSDSLVEIIQSVWNRLWNSVRYLESGSIAKMRNVLISRYTEQGETSEVQISEFGLLKIVDKKDESKNKYLDNIKENLLKPMLLVKTMLNDGLYIISKHVKHDDHGVQKLTRYLSKIQEMIAVLEECFVDRESVELEMLKLKAQSVLESFKNIARCIITLPNYVKKNIPHIEKAKQKLISFFGDELSDNAIFDESRCFNCLRSNLIKENDGFLKLFSFVEMPCEHIICEECYTKKYKVSEFQDCHCLICRRPYRAEALDRLVIQDGVYKLEPPIK